MILRPLRGIDRPAIATLLPTQKGASILLDVGANVDCKSTQLFQFGIMGDVFAKYILDKPYPAVGLLAIGEEATKGNDVTREAFFMLKQSDPQLHRQHRGQAVFPRRCRRGGVRRVHRQRGAEDVRGGCRNVRAGPQDGLDADAVAAFGRGVAAPRHAGTSAAAWMLPSMAARRCWG